jgi:hypothetical protein
MDTRRGGARRDGHVWPGEGEKGSRCPCRTRARRTQELLRVCRRSAVRAATRTPANHLLSGAVHSWDGRECPKKTTQTHLSTEQTKKVCKRIPFRERLKRFEPSTFCMASSKSVRHRPAKCLQTDNSDEVDRGLWFLELCGDTGGLDNERAMSHADTRAAKGGSHGPRRGCPGFAPSRHVPATPVGEVRNGYWGRRRRSPVHSGPHRRRGFASACAREGAVSTFSPACRPVRRSPASLRRPLDGAGVLRLHRGQTFSMRTHRLPRRAFLTPRSVERTGEPKGSSAAL